MTDTKSWSVPRIDHDESRDVGPIVRNGRVFRFEGQSGPEHTRFYAAQLLAAADAAERQIAAREATA